jgi:hypothetical protein
LAARYAEAARSASACRMKRVACTERKKLSACRSWSSASARRPGPGETAREIYFVDYDPDTLAVDAGATQAARDAERQARLGRGRPYLEFVSQWATEEPPAHLPYYGSWGDDSVIHATAWATSGPVRVAAPIDQLPQIFLPDPNVLALAAQQARIAQLEAQLAARPKEREGR